MRSKETRDVLINSLKPWKDPKLNTPRGLKIQLFRRFFCRPGLKIRPLENNSDAGGDHRKVDINTRAFGNKHLTNWIISYYQEE